MDFVTFMIVYFLLFVLAAVLVQVHRAIEEADTARYAAQIHRRRVMTECRKRNLANIAWEERCKKLLLYAERLERNNPWCRIEEARYRKSLARVCEANQR